MGQVVPAGASPATDRVAKQLMTIEGFLASRVTVVVVDRDIDAVERVMQAAIADCCRVIVVALSHIPDQLFDYLERTVDDLLDWDAHTIDVLESRLRRWDEIDEVLGSKLVREHAAGTSQCYMNALAQIVEFARYSDAPVLITGETGTGKEVAARLIHSISNRSSRPLVIVDCTTIVTSLSGSELFGHERGSFTGAISTRTGAVAAADGGTLFLDEIGELPISTQAELLRVIQEGTYKRVGGDRWLTSKFRLISATNRDLEAEVEAGRFRADLYHRIAAGRVAMPPLRERMDDLEVLFGTFLKDALGTPEPPALSLAVQRALRRRSYPGNLRDLRQLALRVAARHAGPGPVTLGDLPFGDRTGPPPIIEPDADAAPDSTTASPDADAGVRPLVSRLIAAGNTLRDITRLVSDAAVDVALDASAGSTRSAARVLGITERAIQLRRAALRSVEIA